MRRGVTMLEIMVVVLLLGFAIVPLMNLGRSTHRQAFFAEHHLLASMRGRMVLDLAAAVDFEIYDALAKKAGGTETAVDLEQMLGPGTIAGLYQATMQGTAAYAVKLPNLAHDVRFARLDASTGRLDVTVGWSMATDKAGAGHSVKLSRIIHRREVGTNQRYRL
jgi:hypothetical protein